MDDLSDFERKVYRLGDLESRAAQILKSREFGDVMGGLVGGSLIGLIAAAANRPDTLACAPSIALSPYFVDGMGYLYHKIKGHEEKAVSTLTNLKDKKHLLYGVGLCAGATAAYFLWL